MFINLFIVAVYMDPILQTPAVADFQEICACISKFELDDRELKREEFCAAYYNKQLLGFGRLRKHKECMEICSLGVLPPFRGKGIGKSIATALIKKATTPVYVVCIIPDFFKHVGFKQVQTVPFSIQEKLIYCSDTLLVEETYVAMRLD